MNILAVHNRLAKKGKLTTTWDSSSYGALIKSKASRAALGKEIKK